MLIKSDEQMNQNIKVKATTKHEEIEDDEEDAMIRVKISEDIGMLNNGLNT